MAMTRTSRYIAVRGSVDRILGSHDTTDVRITEHTSTRHDAAHHADPVDPAAAFAHPRTETHTFINTTREFVMLIEVAGRTLRLASDDYIALARGDEVRAICEPTPNGPLRVLDWTNVTRGIRFRTVPAPLTAIIRPVAGAAVCVVFAAAFIYAAYPVGMIAAVVGALALAGSAVSEGSRLSRAHAAIDELAAQ